MNNNALFKREELVKKICAKLNNFVDLKHTLITIIDELKELTGFDAISIRLQDEGDYPYYVYNGFKEDFIKKENFLCTKSNCAPTANDKGLDCLCGRVISDSMDKSLSFYTDYGSYWTNNSTDTTPLLLEHEKTINIRNHCNASGYLSVGLFPIKTREETIGLIQLNDKRPDLFSEKIIEYLEMIGSQIGVAIENAQLYEKLKNKNTELENTLGSLTHLQDQLVESKKMSSLADLVTGVAHEVYQPITKSLQLIDTIIAETKTIEQKSPGLEKLLSEERQVHEMLTNARALVKSFRSVAFDQFQESRHLININNFFRNVITVIKPGLKNKQVDFVIECNKDSEIMGFTGILSQIITQLIHNAHQHGFKGSNRGIITLGCGIFNDDNLAISVSDNGSGIDPSIQHKIFEPFFTTEKKERVGLGLHAAKNLSKNKLKGDLILDTAHKKGSKFVVYFPI